MKTKNLIRWCFKSPAFFRFLLLMIILNGISELSNAQCNNNWSGSSPTIIFQRNGNTLSNFTISLNNVGCFSSISFSVTPIILSFPGAIYTINSYPNTGSITIYSYNNSSMSGSYSFNLAMLHPIYGYPIPCGSTSGSWNATAETPPPTANAGRDVTICEGENVTLTATGGGTYSWSGGITNGIPFTPTESATYTVTVTADNGCTDTDDAMVTVKPLPTADAGDDKTVCEGESTSLTATGGGTYSWSGGITNGVQFTPTESKTYTVTVTADNGCTDTDDAMVTVKPLPTADAGVDQTVCNGESTTLTATGGGTYSWTGGIINGVPFTPTEYKTYTVTVTAENGCTDTDDAMVTVDQCNSKPIYYKSSTLKSALFPNPTPGEFTFEITSNEPKILIRIYSVGFEEVYSREFENLRGVLKEKINLVGQIPGIYFVSIYDGKEKRTKKIILK